MQLNVARLCLDCEDIHEQQTCPVCGSESFAFISRWIPPRERPTPTRTQPLPSPEAADTYRQLISPTEPASSSNRWLRRGAMGLAAVSMAGWAWRRSAAATPRAIDARTPDSAPLQSDPDALDEKR